MNNEHLCKTLNGAIEKGHDGCVKILLDQGADVNSKNEEDGWALIHSAIVLDLVKCIVLLLEHGADIQEDENWEKALYWANEETKVFLEEYFSSLSLKEPDHI